MKAQVIKSEIFSEYNRIKASDDTNMNRRITNRALGLVQSETHRPYRTTETSCTCPHFLYRKTTCKHMKALRISNAAQAAKLEKSRNSQKSLLELAIEAYQSRNQSRQNWRTGETIRIWEGNRNGKKVLAFLCAEHGRVMLHISGYPKAVKIGSGTGNINVNLEADYQAWANRAKKYAK